MFGKNPRVNPLVSRKQLLVAESEINRAQMLAEWREMTEGVRSLAARVKSISLIASSAAALAAGLAAFRRAKPADDDPKPSWLGKVIKGASLVSTLWMAFRSRQSDPENTPPNPPA